MTTGSGHVSGTPEDADVPRQRRIARLNWILTALAVPLVVAGEWAHSVPGGNIVAELGAMLMWLVLGVAWLAAAATTWRINRRAARQRLQRAGGLREVRPRGRDYWRFALIPALAVTGMLLADMEVGLRIRFQLDRSELDAYAARARAGDTDTHHPPRRIGTLPVASAEDSRGCLFIEARDAGLFSRNGYVNCLSDPPRHDSTYEFRHMGGNWYTWNYSEPF